MPIKRLDFVIEHPLRRIGISPHGVEAFKEVQPSTRRVASIITPRQSASPLMSLLRCYVLVGQIIRLQLARQRQPFRGTAPVIVIDVLGKHLSAVRHSAACCLVAVAREIASVLIPSLERHRTLTMCSLCVSRPRAIWPPNISCIVRVSDGFASASLGRTTFLQLCCSIDCLIACVAS